MSEMLGEVTWYRGSSIRIRRAGLEIHVDPLGVEAGAHADVILLTHPHYDNFSEDAVDGLRTSTSVVIAPVTMKKLVDGADHLMRAGDLVQMEGVDILAVPAHNVDKHFHRPEDGWLGYVFTVGGVTYYHAGDTDFLPSMFGIRCDVAFLPCGGHYTMGPEEAARAAEACAAKIVVPIHWGDPHGTRQDAERIAEMFSGRVQILERRA